jgi:Co/Zn/Cd efflux system component
MGVSRRTMVLAIVALSAGKFLGWVWLDAVMGLVGAVVISLWAYGLVRETGVILLDGSADTQIRRDILNLIEADADNRITDLHVLYLGPDHLAATIALVTHYPQPPEHYKILLTALNLSHVVVEVNPCHGEPCLTASRFSSAAQP